MNVDETPVTLNFRMEPEFAIILAAMIVTGAKGDLSLQKMLSKSTCERFINFSHDLLRQSAQYSSNIRGVLPIFQNSNAKISKPRNEEKYKNIPLKDAIDVSITVEPMISFILAMLINETAQGDNSIIEMITGKAVRNFEEIANQIPRQVSEKSPTYKTISTVMPTIRNTRPSPELTRIIGEWQKRNADA